MSDTIDITNGLYFLVLSLSLFYKGYAISPIIALSNIGEKDKKRISLLSAFNIFIKIFFLYKQFFYYIYQLFRC